MLAENLKKIRKENNLSQEQLADELGVSRQAVSKWESGTAYPEMEKIIQICQRFDYNIDDLLNKDIKEVKREQESKNGVNKFIDEFLNFITNTVNLFSRMSFKTKLKCIIEQIVIISILIILLLIIGGIGSIVVNTIFHRLLTRNLYDAFYSIIEGLYIVFAFITIMVVLIHIFRIRYLNYYINYNDTQINNQDLIKKETNIVIRDPKHSEYKFINKIFKLLILCVKCFLGLGALFLCLLLVCLIAVFVISFSIIKTGIFFIGLVICILSLSVADITIILLIFNFILDRKNDKKKMIWTFIISMITLGLGCGLTFIGMLKFNIIDEVDSRFMETKTYELEMTDDLTIVNHDELEYVIKDIPNIVFEYDVNKKCDLKFQTLNNYDMNTIYFWNECLNDMETIRMIISEINHYNLINVNNDISNIKVYSSKENINKLKANLNKYEIKENTYFEYQKTIDELELKLEEKNNKIDKLQEKINELEEQLIES